MVYSSLAHFLGNRRIGWGSREYNVRREREIEARRALEQEVLKKQEVLSKKEHDRIIKRALRKQRRKQEKQLRKEKKALELANKLKLDKPQAQRKEKLDLGKGLVGDVRTTLKPKAADKERIRKATKNFDVKTLSSQLKRSAQIVREVSISAAQGKYNPLIKQAGSRVLKKIKTGPINLKQGLGALPIRNLLAKQTQKVVGQITRAKERFLDGQNRYIDEPGALS